MRRKALEIKRATQLDRIEGMLDVLFGESMGMTLEEHQAKADEAPAEPEPEPNVEAEAPAKKAKAAK